MKKHEQLKEEAEKAINELIGDMSVGWDTTLDDLEHLSTIITLAIEAIEEEHREEL